MRTIIVWFRSDLRVHDIPMLTAAARDADRIVPVFVFDRALTNGPRASANRNRFLLESLRDLKTSLQQKGGDLVVRAGGAEKVLSALAEQTKADAIYYTIDYTPYARQRDLKAAQLFKTKFPGVLFKGFPGRLVVDSVAPLTTANNQSYKIFTPFYKHWLTITRRPVAPSPRTVTLPSGVDVGDLTTITGLTPAEKLSPKTLVGGESAGRKRLQDFLYQGLQDYHKDNNDLGADATSHLSAYLHFGCLSAHEAERLLPVGPGPDAFRRQLAWRDFYDYILLHFPTNISQEFQEKYRGLPWNADKELLHAWKEGRTGYPAVDAGMRQLKLEGWMHNRARLITGSFLTKDLGLDWRFGEAHFMRWLCDGDVGNNNGNWQWIASVGADAAPVFRRLYNPTSQAKTYDPDGVYIRKYLPELSRVPAKYLAEPWKMSTEEQQKAGCKIGTDYPEPIVDHAEARRAALARYHLTG